MISVFGYESNGTDCTRADGLSLAIVRLKRVTNWISVESVRGSIEQSGRKRIHAAFTRVQGQKKRRVSKDARDSVVKQIQIHLLCQFLLDN